MSGAGAAFFSRSRPFLARVGSGTSNSVAAQKSAGSTTLLYGNQIWKQIIPGQVSITLSPSAALVKGEDSARTWDTAEKISTWSSLKVKPVENRKSLKRYRYVTDTFLIYLLTMLRSRSEQRFFGWSRSRLKTWAGADFLVGSGSFFWQVKNEMI